MPYLKGSLSRASIEKMRQAKLGKKLGPQTPEHRAKLSAANAGRVAERKYRGVCACGQEFVAGASNAVFCSIQCRRAARGHGLRHAPEFRKFAQLCAICGVTTELVGDHDHATGKARGILCRSCNLAIGNMADDPARLRAAAAYLEGQ